MGKFYLCYLFLLLCNSQHLYAQCALDTILPNAICLGQPLSVCVNNNGVVWVNAISLDGGSYDNCTIQNYKINGQDSLLLDCTSINNPLSVTLEVYDFSNNVGMCTAQIIVHDTLLPQTSCQNITVDLDSNGLATVLPTDIEFYSIDNCQVVTRLIDGQQSIQFDCDSVTTSPHTAILTVIDNGGNQNTCQANITIEDNSPPTAFCLNTATVYLDSSGLGMLPAQSLDGGSTDNCTSNSALMFDINGDSVWNCSCYNVGIISNLTLTVDDEHGNMVSCMTSVDVVDSIAPVAQCKSVEIYLGTTGNAAVSAVDIDDSSSDNCSISSRTFLDGSFIKNYTCTDVGVHQVTLLVRDPSGNVAACQTTVTVRDTMPPTVVCNNAHVNLTGTSLWILTPADVGASYDNCALDTMYLTPSVFTCQDLGVVTYSLTAEDVNGNITTCIDSVSVFADYPTIIDPVTDSVFLCTGDSLRMEATTPSNSITYNADWIGPSGLIASGPISGVIDSLTWSNNGWYFFEIIPSNGQGCPTTDSFYVEMDSCLLATTSSLGNDRIQEGEIHIFPNPTTGSFTIEHLHGMPIDGIEIYTMAGQMVASKQIHAKNSCQLDGLNLPNGMYSIRILTTAQPIVKLLSIQR